MDQTAYVARVFNEMAGEYDHLKDPWYRYTFSEIEKALRHHFRPYAGRQFKPLGLDIGCGTGIQSLILAELGYRVEGIDIADDLLEIARAKLSNAGYSDVRFQHADATTLPFESGTADVVNCCGPTLSFVPDWQKALREISRCLKPGGKLLLEVEGRWTPDIFWEVINALIGNHLGYDKSLGSAVKQLLPPWNRGCSMEYSFVLESGETVKMPLRMFTAGELSRELARVGLVVERRWGLHCFTNIIPSTLLHRADASPLVWSLFRKLAYVERLLHRHWPFNALACSLLVVAIKEDSA